MYKKNLTNSTLIKIAYNLGYKKVKGEYCHGQLIFKKGRNYISYDIDNHNGGFWKKAKTINKLKSKETRTGTYNKYIIECIGS